MATVECKSSQQGVPPRLVQIDHISNDAMFAARTYLDQQLAGEGQISSAVANALVYVASQCPAANPSDLWQHVLYRHLLESGWSDQRWKRVSGFALERALVGIFSPRLLPHGLRMRIIGGAEANGLLEGLGLIGTRATKVDLFLEGQVGDDWVVFGAAHVKSSIAERIQDDVPASLAFMEKGLLSIALTMDAKSYPPPHGDCVNYGELGGRSLGVEKERLKRGYIETAGQFDALFSFNLRTPPSGGETPSGKRIFTMGLFDSQPDALIQYLLDQWGARQISSKP
jgi:hypothetical protein